MDTKQESYPCHICGMTVYYTIPIILHERYDDIEDKTYFETERKLGKFMLAKARYEHEKTHKGALDDYTK